MGISHGTLLTILLVGLLLQATPAHCFGAGNVPSYSYLEGTAFRHGDLADTLSEIAKSGGGAAGLFGSMTGGLLAKKFGGLDIKQIYFGNWLRDYSQAMDVAGLSKLQAQTIINLLMALGFLAFGYATGEFEITEARLGVYLPVEHIDNPLNYNDNKDARTVHPKLRPPVDPMELEIDPRTGMLNYIANENGHWDTSKALIRRTLLQCIDMGRRAKHGGGGSDAKYEAYRLLGQSLHTLEDFPAHSNYCELALLKLGHHQVFCHVGSSVTTRAPNGQMVPPLVTGTFGGSDFIHSLLGEANDHISSASVSDLQKEMDRAVNTPGDRGIDTIRDLMFQMPGGEGGQLSREMDGISNLRATTGDPSQMSPQQLHDVLWKVLTFRDNFSKGVERTIEKIPGLSSLMDKISDSLAKFVFTTLEPYLKPIMQQATSTLSEGSAAVVNSQDQFRVFNDPSFAHPTHSMLSKDHFNLILNSPAGEVAKIIVKHVATDVVKCWSDTSVNANQVVESLLDALHHPHFSQGTPLQREMEGFMQKWINNEDRGYTLNALTKESVRAHKNHRKGHPTEHSPGGGGGGSSSSGFGGINSFISSAGSGSASGFLQQQAASRIPGYSQFQQTFPGRDAGASPYDNGPSGAASSYHHQVSSAPSHSPYPAHDQYGQQPYGAQGGQGYGQPQAWEQRVNEPPYPDYQHQQPAYDQGPSHHGYGGGPNYGQDPQYGGGPPPPPPQQGGWGMPPPPGPPQGGVYPGAQWQQQHHSGPPGGYSGNQYGSNWNNNAPPPGRW